MPTGKRGIERAEWLASEGFEGTVNDAEYAFTLNGLGDGGVILALPDIRQLFFDTENKPPGHFQDRRAAELEV